MTKKNSYLADKGWIPMLWRWPKEDDLCRFTVLKSNMGIFVFDKDVGGRASAEMVTSLKEAHRLVRRRMRKEKKNKRRKK